MRVFLRGLNVFCALALISSLAATAMAQQVPVRVVQSSDGTLYVLQGSNSWTLVPDQLSDSDAAALNPGGEIDGTVPTDLFVVQAPAAPPQAPPAPVAAPPAAAPPPPTPTPAPMATPIAGIANLTGKAGNDVQNATLIAPGATITSVVDINTKPFDVYAINLSAGHRYLISTSTTNGYGGQGMAALVLNPDATVANQSFVLGGYHIPGCWSPAGADTCSFTVAVDGTYYIKMQASTSAENYTFTVKQTS
jgi:hypothetical protein